MYIFVALCVLLSWIFITYIYKPLNYWKDRNVPHLKPVLFFGIHDVIKVALGKLSYQDIFINIHNAFPDKRYTGYLLGFKPLLEIRDAELIKDIWVKDFNYFVNHVEACPGDNVMSRTLLGARDQKWKKLRCILSPAFSSGKLKAMHPLVDNAAKHFVDYYRELEGEVFEFNARETFKKFSNDAIAATIFGISCNSFKDDNNEFYRMGKIISNISGLQAFKIALSLALPQIMKVLKVQLYPEHVIDYYRNIVKSSISYLEKNSVGRPNLIHLLIQARNLQQRDTNTNIDEENNLLSDDDITAQAIIFYFAGIDTTSIQLAFIAYELAVNQDIQNKLRGEILDAMEQGDGLINYETVLKMKYLDMVVSEGMRKWPPPHYIPRDCTTDYTIEPTLPGEQRVDLKVGDTVSVSLLGLQRDPKYFPSPEKFDPERFNDENKHKIVPYSFLPFSVGPRNCIASRLALLNMKTFIVHMLANFQIEMVDRTPMPLKFEKFSINSDAEDGIWIGIRKLNV